MINYQLTVDGRTYRVELDDLDASPILVRVDGHVYAVDVGGGEAPAAQAQPVAAVPVPGAGSPVATAAPAAGQKMIAPMPGTILQMMVKPGDTVAFGDHIGVLEAMKMKTVLRAERAGTVAEVRVVGGQSVAHGDVLLVFA